jgi:hypothetical protein
LDSSFLSVKGKVSEGVRLLLEITDQCVPFYEARKERKGNGESEKVKNEGEKDDRLYSGHWNVRMSISCGHVCL